MNRHCRAALAAMLVLAGTSGAGAQDSGWAPDAVPSVINPAEASAVSGWEAYKNSPTRPSADRQLDDPILRGAIDIHAHTGPDTYNRQWDAFEIAERAQFHGLRAIVLKSHWTETAAMAQLAQTRALSPNGPPLEVFGGIALNVSVGGINPMAVRVFAEMSGGRAKVLWLPTHDSEHEVRVLGQQRPYVIVSQDGVLLPQMLEVLDLVAQYHLTLATGHVSPAEMLQIVAAARARGITRIIITHPGLGPQFTDPTLEQLQGVVGGGAFAEIVASELFAPTLRADTVAMIRTLGPANCIVSTDSGLVGTPYHTDALVMAANILREAGFTEAELDLMFRRNPAAVLGLE